MARNEAYTAARLASEELLRRDIQAADAIAGATIASADAAWRKRNCAAAEKDAAYAMAADNRAAAYAEAEQQHRDRLAAIQRHFGQQVTSHGSPDAGHALAFVETVADPEGQFAPVPVEAASNGVRGIGRVVEIAYNGIKRQVRVDANGRVVAESPIADDGWSRRRTFAGDAEAFMAAKRAGVGLKSDPDEPPPAPPIPPPPMIRAEPQPEQPPPGLLADIAAALARAESELR
jgi:hypothetical protein